MVLKPSLFQYCFASRDWQYSNSHKLEARSKSHTPFTTEARVVRQTHSVFFFYWCQVPLYACAVARMLWKSCPATRSPSCGRLHRQTLLSPCLHPPVSPLLPRKCLVGRTMAPSHLQAPPTPRRCDDSKDKKTEQTSVLDFAISDDMAVIFSVYKAARRTAKKTQNSKSSNMFPWPHNSVGYKVRSSRRSAERFLASPHARDDVEPRTPWRTPSCKSLGNHLQQLKKHHEQTVTQTVFEGCSYAKRVMKTRILDNVSDFSRQYSKQYSNSIQNSN